MNGYHCINHQLAFIDNPLNNDANQWNICGQSIFVLTRFLDHLMHVLVSHYQKEPSLENGLYFVHQENPNLLKFGLIDFEPLST